MTSGRQHRTQIKQHRSGKRAAVAAEDLRIEAKRAAKERALRLRDKVLVNVANLRPDNSYGAPDFVGREFYVDRRFQCKDCGKDEVWTATQQKWWYESAKGGIWTMATRCRPCRRRERERVAEARRVQQEGMARKKNAR